MTANEMKFGKDGMDMAMTSFGAWTKSAQAIAAEANPVLELVPCSLPAITFPGR